MEKVTDYVSPNVKVIVVVSTEVLCSSTESYGVCNYNYGEDDWE